MCYTPIRTVAALTLICLSGVALSACGSGGSGRTATDPAASSGAQNTSHVATQASGNVAATLPSDAVARVGAITITRTTLARWMPSLVGGDFYEISGVTAPRGLVSDPPNYSGCVAGLQALAGAGKGPSASVAHRKTQCVQLYEAIKQQTIEYLIDAQWAIDFDAEQGLYVTNKEIHQEYARLRATNFPKEGELQSYLADRGWPLSVELFLIKHDLLSKKLQEKLKALQNSDAFAKYVAESTKRWTSRTSCRAGYLVEQCSQYSPQHAPLTPSPATLIEAIAPRR
jgi:hypothetical protein